MGTRIIQPPSGWVVPTGLCECGCGAKTPIAKQTHKARDQYYGFPLRFLRGHNTNLLRGEKSPRWRGGRWLHDGYWMVYLPDHPRANPNGYVPEHRLVWERTRGYWPDGKDIHHIDGDRGNNDPSNLEKLDRDEHLREHSVSQRMRLIRSRNGRKRFSDPRERKKQSRRMKEWWAKRKAG